MSYQLKLWDSKREREKINRPEHTAGRSQNKGTEQAQRRARRLRTGPAPPETGGRGEGKGAGSAPRTAALPHCKQASNRNLLRLGGRHPLGGSRRDTGRRRGLGLGTRRAEGARTQLARAETEAGTRGGEKARRTRGECARQTPGCLSRSDGEGTKRSRSFLSRAFVEHPRAGTALSAGPAPCRAAGSLSSVEGKQRQPLPAARRNQQPEQGTTSARLCQGGN